MKKLQRILAILGVVLLLALYASTMILPSPEVKTPLAGSKPLLQQRSSSRYYCMPT